MDCNREEALRAKDIAENKMNRKDYTGAQKFALKAKQLYPDVENISQILIVCEVHCSAAKKLSGDEFDWYAILQIEKTADEATIKKQYRKFALQLHPDKNKFAGAECAFKLIGEAQRILLDKDKRRVHDMKRGPGLYRPPPHGASWNANVAPSVNRTHPLYSYAQNQPPAQPPLHQRYQDLGQSFWTICPFCSVKYQYYKEIMNRSIQCQTCSKPFVAYDMVAPPASFSRVFPHMKNNASPKVKVPVQQNFGTGNSRANTGKNAACQSNGNPPDAGMTKKVNQERAKKRGRRRNHVSDSESSSESSSDSSSESSDEDSESSDDSEPEIQVDENDGDQNVRRSSRNRQKVSYKENLSDGDDDDHNGQPSKKAKRKRSSDSNGGDVSEMEPKKKNGVSRDDDVVEVKMDDGKEEEPAVNGDRAEKSSEPCEYVDLSSETEDQSSDLNFSYPDSDFTNFGNGRRSECFAAGQVWAAYDEHAAMPRFYAKIKKVLSPGFRVQITWLEPDPDDENGIKWVFGGLPVSCGKFTFGGSDETDNLQMFSHLMDSVKGIGKGSFMIFPRKGETWGLFKNWDIKWASDPAVTLEREFEFEFVEVLSDYNASVGIHVALLSKVDGFVSLFIRTSNIGKRTLLIPPDGLLRFSHMVPSSKITGKEGDGVPTGSYELDPASLPLNLLGPPKDKPNEANPEEGMEIPEPEFHNFDMARSEDKFKVGQVWALYCDEDGLPKYYCKVVKVVAALDFKLYVSWLSARPRLGNATVVTWSDPEMPVCCGRFRLKRNRSQPYESLNSFSHQVQAAPADSKDEFTILPRKGEVWALYKNWRLDLKVSNLKTCSYDYAEVLSSNNSEIRVRMLRQLPGFTSVFKPCEQLGSQISPESSITMDEILRFAYQVPAFQLKEQRGGLLRGFWELDPAALPRHP